MLLAKTYLGTMYKVGTRSSYKHSLYSLKCGDPIAGIVYKELCVLVTVL